MKVAVYVDGSYRDGVATWAFAVFVDGVFKAHHSGVCQDRDSKAHHNVAGEIMAAGQAVYHCDKVGYTEITIHYDYEGIEMWATNKWKANKFLTKWYKMLMKRYMEDMIIHFIHVKAHSGDANNNMVDELARNELETELKRRQG